MTSSCRLDHWNLEGPTNSLRKSSPSGFRARAICSKAFSSLSTWWMEWTPKTTS
ncbi:MAG TPA: hypothetical protein PLL76_08920 [Thermoanaerobaculia bacterium]|nr:hypothetical protein [Thermoanaerobaculia bacterium]HQP86365.1 hypothetical protein [Thermoanaerobaculia bacterium]